MSVLVVRACESIALSHQRPDLVRFFPEFVGDARRVNLMDFTFLGGLLLVSYEFWLCLVSCVKADIGDWPTDVSRESVDAHFTRAIVTLLSFPPVFFIVFGSQYGEVGGCKETGKLTVEREFYWNAMILVLLVRFLRTHIALSFSLFIVGVFYSKALFIFAFLVYFALGALDDEPAGSKIQSKSSHFIDAMYPIRAGAVKMMHKFGGLEVRQCLVVSMVLKFIALLCLKGAKKFGGACVLVSLLLLNLCLLLTATLTILALSYIVSLQRC